MVALTNSMPTSLFSLPLELREAVYEHLFASITVRHGFDTRSTSHHRTAILQTSKQIHHEAWRHLPLNIRLHFRGTETMLATLLSVGQSVITRLRHIRVKAFPFPLYASGRPEYYPIFYFHNALSMLPGLCLDRLTVEDSFHGFGMVEGWRDVVTYFDIESLLKSDAWKELIYITPNTDFITSGYDHRKKRQAQPETWNAMLTERDGEGSGARVQMLITPEPDIEIGEGPLGREPRPWSAVPGHEVIENWRLAGPEQDLKGEVRIVAQRGKRAIAVQTGLSEKRSWEELKNKPGEFMREDWTPYYNDIADAVGWTYGGWGRRMQLALMALNQPGPVE